MIADIEPVTLHFTQLEDHDMNQFLGFILSGSSYDVTSFYYKDHLRNKFQLEMDIIKNFSQIPILGVYFGHQLIAYAYNSQICRMRIRDYGDRIITIKLEETDELITKKEIPVNVHHRDFVTPNDINIIENFQINCISNYKRYNVVQYMRHKENPTFAMQFHPETHDVNNFHPELFDEDLINRMMTIGQEIIENFIWHCIYVSEN